MVTNLQNWVVIDTACALGIAVVQGGTIVSSGAWLIQPPENRYDRRNSTIHGLNARSTKRSPNYAELYTSIAPFLQDRYVLAHWAEFDVSVLRALHAYYGIPLPNVRYACSCRMAQRAFPQLCNHQLPTVCGHCGISLQHHDATSDALACAQVALNCRDAAGVVTIHEAVGALGLRLGSV